MAAMLGPSLEGCLCIPLGVGGGKARSHGKVSWALVAFSQHFHWQDKSFLPQPHISSMYLKLSQKRRGYGPAALRHPWPDIFGLPVAAKSLS